MVLPNNAHLVFCENFHNQIDCFQLSEYEWSNKLIGISVAEKIILGELKYRVSKILIVAFASPNF